MKKSILHLSARFLLTVASLYLFNSPSSLACSGGPPPERYYVSYFDPEILGDTTYRACYIDAPLYLPQFWEDVPIESRYKSNILEWQQYCNGKPAAADIADIVYKADKSALEERALKPLQSGAEVLLPLSRNSFIRQLAQKKDLNAIRYLIFSKECEQQVNNGGYDWEGSAEKDTTLMQALIEHGKQLAAETSSTFLRLRYGFQIVRLAHYSGSYKQAIALYDEWVKPIAAKSQSDAAGSLGLAYYWATALKAGAYLHMGQNAESLYWFSKVFAGTSDRRDVMLLNFGNPSEEIWRKALSMAATPEEKAVLWFMRGSNNTELDFEALKNMQAQAPQFIGTEVLLLREINKVERVLLSPYLTQSLLPPPSGGEEWENEGDSDEESEGSGYLLPPTQYSSKNQASLLESITDFFRSIWQFFRRLFGWGNQSASATDTTPVFNGKYLKDFENRAYVKELRDFVAKVAKEGKVRNAAVWQVGAAYLSYLSEDYSDAVQWLDAIKTSEKPIVQQAAIVRGLNEIAQKSRVTPQAEADLHKGLTGRDLPTDEYNNYSVTSRVLAATAQKYIQQGDIGKAALCLAKAGEMSATNILLDCYASQEDLEKMLAYVSERPQTDFDAYLRKNSFLKRDVVLDIQGTKLLRKGQYAEALKKLEQIAPSYWSDGNNERGSDDYGYWAGGSGKEYDNFIADFGADSNEDSGKTYNKLTFTRQVVELLQRAEGDTKKADQYYYQLGNGFLHSPFWGYNGRLWRGNLVYTLGYGDNIDYPLNIPSMADTLLKAQHAFKSEYGTRDVAKHFYEKVYTISKDNELAAESVYMAKLCENEPFASFHQGDTENPTLPKLLAGKYSNTDFYKSIIEQCADLAVFLK